jgi:hypothetical protein
MINITIPAAKSFCSIYQIPSGNLNVAMKIFPL